MDAEPENAEERTLLALLSHEPCHIDDIIRTSDLPTMTVTSTLLMMELKGMIKQAGGDAVYFGEVRSILAT